MTTKGKSLLYMVLGWACVGLGAVGTLVPGLPTVPFLLLALWAFGRASPRWRDWLRNHPRYGPPLRAWADDGVISPRAKLAAATTMGASLALTAALIQVGWILALQAAVLLPAAAFVLSRPSARPAAIDRAGARRDRDA